MNFLSMSTFRYVKYELSKLLQSIKISVQDDSFIIINSIVSLFKRCKNKPWSWSEFSRFFCPGRSWVVLSNIKPCSLAKCAIKINQISIKLDTKTINICCYINRMIFIKSAIFQGFSVWRQRVSKTIWGCSGIRKPFSVEDLRIIWGYKLVY